MPNYLQYFPQPFLEDLVSNRCIPIVGAGFSRNADLPTGLTMPLWEDLGIKMAQLLPDYQYVGAVDAISAYSHEYSRIKLVEKLSELLFINSVQAGATHKAFCELPFELVCTTNMDFLLEKGYELVGRYCRPVIDEERLATATDGMGVTLLKLHGDLHHPNRLIVTEDDYDCFIEKYPLLATFLANLLISKPPLFIGYSLDDPDFRSIWQLIGDRLGRMRRQAYTIAFGAPAYQVSRFERRSVKVINLPGRQESYSDILKTVFKELREYWPNKVIEKSTITEEDSLAELSLPKEAKSRLCFFSLPFRLLSIYKTQTTSEYTNYAIELTNSHLQSKIMGLLSDVNVVWMKLPEKPVCQIRH